MFKKSIALLLSLMMLCTLIPMGTLQAFAAETDTTSAVSTDGEETTAKPDVEPVGDDYPDLVLGTNTATISSGGTRATFRFVPAESRQYVFYSQGSDDTYGHLLGANMNQLASNDDDGEGNNFKITRTLEAGVTYYLQVRYYDSTYTGSFSVIAEATPYAESLTINQGDSITGNVNTSVNLIASLAPANSYADRITWASSDESIAVVSGYGSSCSVTLLAAGVVTITATSGSILTDSIQITVKDVEDLPLDTAKTADIDAPGQEVLFRFTAPESREYQFYSTGELDTCAVLCDEDMDRITTNDNGGEDENFKIAYNLTANQVYYLKVMLSNVHDIGSFDVYAKATPYAQSLTINQGDSYSGYRMSGVQLNTTFAPIGSYQEDITWTSTNAAVATVDSNGYVFLETDGVTTVTATSERGLTDSIAINVMPPEGLNIDNTAQFDHVPYSTDVLYHFTPAEDGFYDFIAADNNESNWTGITLYDEDFNYLDETDGCPATLRVTLEGGKDYYVKSSFADNDVNGTINTTVTKTPTATGITITDGDDISVYKGTSFTLHTAMIPENALEEEIAWSSSNEDVATVNNGSVSTLAPGTAVITASTASGLSDTFTVTVVDYPVIAADETKTVEITSPGNIAYYSFTPAESGTYAFYSISNSDTYGYLYNADKTSLLKYNDDSGNGNNFRIEYDCEAGVTYLLGAKYLSTGNTGSFNVTVRRLVTATGITITEGEGRSCDVSNNFQLHYTLEPEGARQESVFWSSSDEDVATVSDSGYVNTLAPGTTDITVTASTTGLSDTFTLTVTEPETIAVDETKHAEINFSYEKVLYRFTPATTGSYRLDVTNYTGYPYFTLYDDDFTDLNSTFSDSFTCRLEAGNTYYWGVRFDDSTTGTVDVTLTAIPAATAISIDEGDAYEAMLFEEAYLHCTFSPEGVANEYVTWTSSDEDVAEVVMGEYILAKAPGTATITATSENGLTDSITFTVAQPTAIALDEVKDVTSDREMFCFTPDTDGFYRFDVYGNDQAYFAGVLYNEDGGSLYHYYNSYGSADLRQALEAGKSYYFLTRYDDSDSSGTYHVKVTCNPPATGLTIPSTYEGYVGDDTTLNVTFTPEGSYSDHVYWATSDNSVVSVNDGYIHLNKVGTATISACLDGEFTEGETATCTVTVKPYDPIAVGDTKTVTDGKAYYSFTPEEDGRYVFYSSYLDDDDNIDPYGILYDEDMNWITSDSYGGNGNNFRVAAFLEAGETYVWYASGNGYTSPFAVTLIETDYITGLELLSPPDKTTYVEGYAGSAYRDYTGISIKATWSDGTEDIWTYGPNVSWNIRGEQISVSTSSAYPDRYSLKCGGQSVTIQLTLIENPVESITCVTPPTSTLIEGADGEWEYRRNSETSENELFFRYNYSYSMFNDTVLQINYKNGTTATATYDEKVDGYYFELKGDNQYGSPWTVGGDNYVTMSYLGVDAQVPVTIEPSPVDYIAVVKESENELIEGVDSSMAEYWDETLGEYVSYLRYDPYLLDDAVVEVHFTDGTVRSVRPGYSLDGYPVQITTDQRTTPWTLGSDNIFTVNYMGKSVDLHATVIENPVDHLEVVSESTYRFIENTGGYDSTDTNGDPYYYYYTDPLRDAVVAICYKDGTVVTAEIEGRVNNHYFNLTTDQYSDPWTVGGDNVYTVTYMGKSVDLHATVIENPVDHIAVTKPSENVLIENADGRVDDRWDDASGRYVDYFRYDLSPLDDTEVTVYYKDGTTKTFTLDDTRLDGYDIEISEDQYRHPWTVGEHECTIHYLGHTATLTATVAENPVDHLAVIKESEYQFIEGNNGHTYREWNDRTQSYETIFIYNTSSLRDTEIAVYYKDGTIGSFTVDDGTYNGYAITTSSDQYNHPWTVGSDNVYTVKYMGHEVELHATVVENPIASIEIVSIDTYTVIENASGEMDDRWNDATQTREEYFRYYLYEPYEATIKVNLKDGTSETVTYENGWNGFGFDCIDTQYDNPWTLGNNTYEISLLGVTATAPARVIENPVASITLLRGTSHVWIEDYDGWWRDDGIDPNTGERNVRFFQYETYGNDLSDALIQINYKNGSTKTAHVGDTVDGEFVDYNTDQRRHPWTVGGSSNTITIEYLGATTEMNATVVSNPVDHITVSKQPAATLYENCDGYTRDMYNPVTDEWDIEYFYYYGPDLSDGEITIYYTDGTTATANFYSTVNGEDVGTSNNQYEEPWTIGGENIVTVSYMGREATFSMPILPNPADHITITKAPTKQYILGDINNMGYSDMTGMEFTLFYKDGTSKSFTDADFDTRRGTVDGHYYKLELITEPHVGTNTMGFTYMGCTTAYQFTMVQSPVQSLEVLNGPTNPAVARYFLADLTGTKIKATFTDGTSRTVTLTAANMTYTRNFNRGTCVTFPIKGMTATIPLSWVIHDGNRYYRVFLGGQTANIPLNFIDTSVTNSIDVENYSAQGTGMTINRTFENGTQDAVTIAQIVYQDNMEGDNVTFMIAKSTDGRLFNMWITTVPGNGSYRVQAFGQFYTPPAKLLLGDVDGDGAVTINDVTVIQRFLAEYPAVNAARILSCGDVDGNGKVSIKDVTAIQRYLAEFGNPYHIGEPIA